VRSHLLFFPFIALTLSTTACGIKERIEERISEKVAEKVIEVAAGGEVEVDIDSRDGKVSIQGKDGQRLEVDGKAGTSRVIHEDGKVYDYAQDGDGSATVKGSDGLEASFGAEIPADFPIPLPAVKQVAMGSSVTSPDGLKTLVVSYETTTTDLAAVEKQIQTAFDGKALTTERHEVTAPAGKVISLVAKSADAKIESSAMLTTNTDAPNVVVTITWMDKSAVAG
jgi:hypothetical protein